MFRGLQKIFLGLLLLLIGIGSVRVDLILDIVGYVFILIGINEMSSQHISFSEARIPVIVLIACSALSLINSLSKSNIFGMEQDLYSIYNVIYTVVTAVSIILFYIKLGRGMADLLAEREQFLSVGKTNNCIRFNVIVQLLVSGMSVVIALGFQNMQATMNIQDLSTWLLDTNAEVLVGLFGLALLTIALGILSLSAAIWLLVRVHKNKKELEYREMIRIYERTSGSGSDSQL